MDTLQRDVSELQGMQRKTDQNLQLQNAESNRLEGMIIHNRQTIDVHHADIQNLERGKMQRIKSESMFKSIQKVMETFKDEMHLGENHLSTVESYIERYLPVKI